MSPLPRRYGLHFDRTARTRRGGPSPRFARPRPARAGARGEVKEIPFSRRAFTPEPCPRPNKQTTAARDLRQTAPMVGPAAITIRHGKASSLRGAFATKQSRLCAADPGLLRRFAPRNDEAHAMATTKKRKAERRKALFNNLRALTGAARPPPSSSPACGGGRRRGPLASRRPTTALAAATERHRSA